jgi:hypothetical protein
VLKILAVAAFFATSSLAFAEGRHALDECEARLRLCFRVCLGHSEDFGVCDTSCTTQMCRGVAGPEKTTTEFLRWLAKTRRIWI